MKLSKVFAKKLVTAGLQDTLAAVALNMQKHNVGTVVIVKDNKPFGIITDRDLALALGAKAISPTAPVEKVMTRVIRTISDNAGIYAATRQMHDHEVRRLPIVDKKNNVVGIVSMDDVLGYLGEELHNLSEGIKHEMQVK
jgi:CBS domain-containing protein